MIYIIVTQIGSVEIREDNINTLPVGALEITEDQRRSILEGASIYQNGSIVKLP